MCAHYQINRGSGLLNQSNGQMRNNEGTKETFNCWGCPGTRVKGESAKLVKFKNLLSIKPLLILRWLLTFVLLTWAGGAWAQGPYPNQGPRLFALGQNEPYGVVGTSGSTYQWTIIPVTGGNGTIAPGNSNTTSVTWTNSGTCNLQVVETTSENCIGNPVQVLITVLSDMTAAAPSSTPTLCINTLMTNITIATTGATGIGAAAGLPAGVTAAWNANVITISEPRQLQVSLTTLYL